MKVIPTQSGVDVGGTAYAVYDNRVRVFLNGRDGHFFFRVDICGTKETSIINNEEAHF